MSHQAPAQPGLTDLLARFLNKQAQAHTDGLADLGPGAEVTPYEAGPVQPIDAKVGLAGSRGGCCFLSARSGRHQVARASPLGKPGSRP